MNFIYFILFFLTTTTLITIKSVSSTTKFLKYDSNVFFGIPNKKYSHKDVSLDVLIFYDKSMISFYGHNLVKDYIYALMHRVKEYYSNSVMNQRSFSIILVDLIEIDKPNKKRSAPSDVVRDLCNLSKSKKDYIVRKNSLERIDVTILLTRDEICKDLNENKICALVSNEQPCVESGCILVQDKNLLTAYALAQKLGHIVGMKELDEIDSIDYHSPGGNLMNPESEYLNDNNYRWSDESINHMNVYLDKDGAGNCLNRQASNEHDKLTSVLSRQDFTKPGKFLSNDLQCQITFGRDAYFDVSQSVQDDCSLTCSIGKRKVKSPVKRFDGSKCGDNSSNKICYYGKCVQYTQVYDKPFYGEWTEWTEWSRCTRSCGEGIRTRTRKCIDKEKGIEGNTCRGMAIESFDCRFKLCDKYPNLYAQKCAQVAKTHLNSTKEWIADYDFRSKSCTMMCESQGESFKTYVPDDSSCGAEMRCIQHTCQSKEPNCGSIYGANVRWHDCSMRCIGQESNELRFFYNPYKRKHNATFAKEFSLNQFTSKRQKLITIPKESSQFDFVLRPKSNKDISSIESRIKIDLMLGTANLRDAKDRENHWIEFDRRLDNYDLYYHSFDSLDKQLDIWIENPNKVEGVIEISYYHPNASYNHEQHANDPNCFTTKYQIQQTSINRSQVKVIPSGSSDVSIRLSYDREAKNESIDLHLVPRDYYRREKTWLGASYIYGLQDTYKEYLVGKRIVKEYKGKGPFDISMMIVLSNRHAANGLLEYSFCLPFNKNRQLKTFYFKKN